MESIARIARPLFWLLLVVIYVIAVMPQPPSTGTGDSYEHALAFFTLTMVARVAMPGAGFVRIALGMAVFGALIEITQLIPALNRQAELRDWLVDLAATGVALLVSAPLVARLRAR